MYSRIRRARRRVHAELGGFLDRLELRLLRPQSCLAQPSPTRWCRKRPNTRAMSVATTPPTKALLRRANSRI